MHWYDRIAISNAVETLKLFERPWGQSKIVFVMPNFYAVMFISRKKYLIGRFSGNMYDLGTIYVSFLLCMTPPK